MSQSLLYHVRGYSGTVTEALVELEELNPARRMRRALAGLGTWWGAGVVCVFIPIAHFVLVPFCFIAGLVTLARRLTVKILVVGGHTTCPDCGAAQDLDLKGPWRGVSAISCRACRRSLILTPAAPAAT